MNHQRVQIPKICGEVRDEAKGGSEPWKKESEPWKKEANFGKKKGTLEKKKKSWNN
jgi:hypothetical protein